MWFVDMRPPCGACPTCHHHKPPRGPPQKKRKRMKIKPMALPARISALRERRKVELEIDARMNHYSGPSVNATSANVAACGVVLRRSPPPAERGEPYQLCKPLLSQVPAGRRQESAAQGLTRGRWVAGALIYGLYRASFRKLSSLEPCSPSASVRGRVQVYSCTHPARPWPTHVAIGWQDGCTV